MILHMFNEKNGVYPVFFAKKCLKILQFPDDCGCYNY